MVWVNGERDTYLWVGPDGTDTVVTTNEILESFEPLPSADPDVLVPTTLEMPRWVQPAVSHDLRHSAVVLNRKDRVETAEGRSTVLSSWLVVISAHAEIIAGVFEVPFEGTQPLVLTEWLPESGCLAVMSSDPGGGVPLIYLLDESGTVRAELSPHLARGSVIEAGGEWLILDRSWWVEGAEIEILNITDPGFRQIVAANDIFPQLRGVDLAADMTVAEAVQALRGLTILQGS